MRSNINISLLFFFLLFSIEVPLHGQELTLQQCLDSAQAHNKLLQIAKNNEQISAEKNKETMTNLIPKINVNADYKYFFDLPTQLLPMSTFNPNAPEGQFREAQLGVAHNIGANVQLIMPIYNPQVYGAIKSTHVAMELSQLQGKKTQEQVYLEVCNLYYNAQILTKQLAFLDSNLANTEKLLVTMKLLKEQQMSKGTDIGKIELQKAQIQVQETTTKNKLEQVLSALKFNMGLEENKSIVVNSEINFTEDVNPSNSNSIDVSIANTQRRFVITDLKNTRRSLLPTLSFIASYGVTGFGYDKKPNDFLKFFPVNFTGIQLTYPLFTGTATLRKINQRKLELKNSELQISIATEQNKMQIKNAVLQKELAKQNIQTTQQQIKQAQAIYSQTILQQKQGLAAITDVLLADNSVREAQQNNLSAIVEYLKSDLELKRLNGNIVKSK